MDQIDALVRPLTMEHGGIVLMDLLWSDPTTNDGVEGVQPSPRGPGLVTFGPDRVKEFCKVWPRFALCRSWSALCGCCQLRAWQYCSHMAGASPSPACTSSGR